MKFEEYFSFEAIVKDLIRWRVKGKGKKDEKGRRDVEMVLPARKMWSRVGVKEREGVAPEVVRRQAIWRTVRWVCGGHRAGVTLPLRWAQNLMRLVDEVRDAVFSGKVAFEAPEMFKIAKGREGGVMQYRKVASFDRLSDRVILSRMTAYVRDRLEAVLGARCYSFRKDRDINHQLAVKRLQEFRARLPVGSLFVAECDIKKFFDNISHETVRRRWNEVGFADAAGKVLEAYLSVYAVEDNGALGTTRPTNAVRRGLPQGGSFSTVLANLVLAAADRAVERVDDGQLFYARYCDDVVFVHPDEATCRRAMEAYAAALAKLDLPMHEVRPFVYRPMDGRGSPRTARPTHCVSRGAPRTARPTHCAIRGSPRTEYYSIKSKGPFAWREAGLGETDCAPWVSFLGSQVRFDGETRIRKESIEKHIRSLGRETAEAVRELQAGALADQPRPVVREWFGRFRNRLIAKGVGYVTAKVKDCDMCWAGAFPNVTGCAETKMQMRRLDRIREGLLAKVAAMLPARHYMTGHRYKGRPFSYYGFLEEATRPTNMNPRRVRKSILPYSEL